MWWGSANSSTLCSASLLDFLIYPKVATEALTSFFYLQQIHQKKSHHAAVRALAYKWIRIIYRCWKDGKPYDEELYLKSLHRRGSLFAGALSLATGAGCK